MRDAIRPLCERLVHANTTRVPWLAVFRDMRNDHLLLYSPNTDAERTPPVLTFAAASLATFRFKLDTRWTTVFASDYMREPAAYLPLNGDAQFPVASHAFMEIVTEIYNAINDLENTTHIVWFLVYFSDTRICVVGATDTHDPTYNAIQVVHSLFSSASEKLQEGNLVSTMTDLDVGMNACSADDATREAVRAMFAVGIVKHI